MTAQYQQAVKLYRDCSAVKRFHIMRSHRNQTVGEHSHGVAVLVMQVDPECSATLLKAALTHDFHERSTGDMPSTTKWEYPELAAAMAVAEDRWNSRHDFNWSLTPAEERILQFCDYLELLFWSIEEVLLGNHFATEPMGNIIRVLDRMEPPTVEAEQIYRGARGRAVSLNKWLRLSHEDAVSETESKA
jgi:5'-deoxynucleotidase YfbR-like HD superfamily hydrolase